MHQSALLQYLQVLHHRCERDIQGQRQARNRQRPLAQLLHDRAPRGIAQRVKYPVDIHSLRGRGSDLFRAFSHEFASSFAKLSNSLRQPSSRIFGPSAPSKYAPCSVKIRSVPFSVGTSSKVASEAEIRRSPSVIV